MTLKSQIDRFSQNEENFNALITGSAGTTVDLGEAGIVKSVATVIGEIAPGVDRGSWATTTAYVINDIVLEGGAYYRCRENHTSGTFATDLAAGKWRLNQGGDSTILTHRGRTLDDVITARFDNVTQMIADVNLVVGDYVVTYANQNGAAVRQEWLIVAAATGTDDGGSYVDLTGSGLQAKQVFSIKDNFVMLEAFGGGSAIADNYTAITSALAAGYDVQIPKGATKIASTITIPANRGIRGAGKKVSYLRITDTNTTALELGGSGCHLTGFTTRTDTSATDFDLRPNSVGLAAPTGIKNNLRLTNFALEYFTAHIDLVGSIFGSTFDDVECNVGWYPIRSNYASFHTSITMQFFKMYGCFHGIDARKWVYCDLDFYYDYCGFGATALSVFPADETPIMFLGDDTICNVNYGVENSPAILFKLSNKSNVTSGANHTYISSSDVWKVGYDGDRDSNIALSEQALFSLKDGSNLELSGMKENLGTAQGYPSALTTATNFIYTHQSGELSKVVLRACYLNIECYWLSNSAKYDKLRNRHFSPDIEFYNCSRSYFALQLNDLSIKFVPSINYDQYDRGHLVQNKRRSQSIRNISGTGTTLTIPTQTQTESKIGGAIRLRLMSSQYNTPNLNPSECKIYFTQSAAGVVTIVSSVLHVGVASVTASANNIIVTLSASTVDPLVELDLLSHTLAWEGAVWGGGGTEIYLINISDITIA